MIWLIAAGLAASQPALRPELEPMRFLVGHCWRGEMNGGAEQDTHCFEPVFGGQHVRDRHEVTGAAGPYRGETLYSWNQAAGRIDLSLIVLGGSASRFHRKRESGSRYIP